MSSGLAGHLDIVCAADTEGRSYLRSQSFRAPIHLSKAHFETGVLRLNVVNPTAGLLDGDRIECRVRVEKSAALLLTTPSASRAHRMRGGFAEMMQDFHVAAEGRLECWPEIFIPQAGTSYRQSSSLEIESGGELIYLEALAPGRVASGESFAFSMLEWRTDLRVGDRLVACERYRLSPESESIISLRRIFETAYYGSIFVVSPGLNSDSPCWRNIHALHSKAAWVGCGRLAHDAWVIKFLAEGSVPFRRLAGEVRGEIYSALGREMPSLRR